MVMKTSTELHTDAGSEGRKSAHKRTESAAWPQRILFASDGSVPAARAADMIAAIVPSGATVRALTVASLEFVPYDGEWGPLSDEPERQARLKAVVEAAFGQPMKKLKSADCKLEKKTRLGNPGEQILYEIREWHPDLVVVGRAGLGGIAKLLLGSVSEHVVKHSRVPVLVVP
jgi:nucleotide-binding universal stress UspA family protein